MPQARPVPPHPGVEILADDAVWTGRFPLQRIAFRHRRFDGEHSGVRTWELWRRGRAAAMLPYDPASDSVVLLEQFRLPALAAGVDPILVEVPAGLCDEGETPEQTLRREVGEEIGLAPSRIHPIGNFLLSPGGCDEYVHLAAGLVQAPRAGADGLAGSFGMAAEHEDIRVRVWPATRAIEAAFDGAFANVVTSL
ncbi:MAG: NUDIX domain-containing protein, partial [Acetobacteraceae bacterium]|nr:NUDIX domain-containing protein [Acetobacteraceae bacterium]